MRPVPCKRLTRTRLRDASGFTLAELLIVVALGLLVTTTAGTVAISSARSERSQFRSQQRHNDWTRFTYFLANEVGEGGRVRTNASPAELASNGCSLPGDGSILFTVDIPIATDTGTPVRRSVHYYTSGTGENTILFRCGPEITREGRLATGSTSFMPARLLSGIPLSAATDSNQVSVTICNYTSPTCNENASGAGAGNIGPFSVRTRSFLGS
jgi:hypothetical protein